MRVIATMLAGAAMLTMAAPGAAKPAVTVAAAVADAGRPGARDRRRT